MKKFLFVTTACPRLWLPYRSTGAVCPNARHAPDSNFSFSVLGGWSWYPDMMLNGAKTGMEDGYNVGARLGYGLSDGWGMNNLSVDARLFLQHVRLQWRQRSRGKNLISSSFMGNLLYHVPTASPWSFYGGGGVGLVNDDAGRQPCTAVRRCSAGRRWAARNMPSRHPPACSRNIAIRTPMTPISAPCAMSGTPATIFRSA